MSDTEDPDVPSKSNSSLMGGKDSTRYSCSKFLSARYFNGAMLWISYAYTVWLLVMSLKQYFGYGDEYSVKQWLLYSAVGISGAGFWLLVLGVYATIKGGFHYVTKNQNAGVTGKVLVWDAHLINVVSHCAYATVLVCYFFVLMARTGYLYQNVTHGDLDLPTDGANIYAFKLERMFDMLSFVQIGWSFVTPVFVATVVSNCMTRGSK